MISPTTAITSSNFFLVFEICCPIGLRSGNISFAAA